MTSPAFCRHCGHALYAGQRFCDGCGQEVAQLPASAPPQDAPALPPPVASQPPPAPPVAAAQPFQPAQPLAAPPASQPPAPLMHVQSAPAATSRPTGKGKSPLPLLVVTAVVLAAAVAAAVMLLGGGGGDETADSAQPLGLTVQGGWDERTGKDLYVTALIAGDLDLNKPPAGPRLSIARTGSGDLDLSQALKEALGGGSPQTFAKEFELVEEPGYVKVGDSYGAAVTVWRKRGSEKPLVTRVIYTAAKQGGYTITLEWPVDESSDASYALLDSLVRNARFSDAAFKGSPPKERSAGEAGPGWPLVSRDTFGSSYGALGKSQTPFQLGAEINSTGHTGTTLLRDGRFVVEGNSTALGRASAINRTGVVCTNCYASVEAQNIGDPASLYGLIIRYQNDTQAGYRVTLQDSAGAFRVTHTEASGTVEVIPSARSDAIKPGQVNRIGVLLEGQRVVVWINGQKIGEANHNGQKTGDIGLYFAPNVTGRYGIAYDNFELRAVE